MNDKQFDQLKNRVRKYVTKWRNVLGLWNWQGDIVWERDSRKDDVKGTEKLASCYCDWRYLEYQITFFMSSYLNKTNRDLERIVVHEMCHILLNEMREEGVNHEERVVSHLTNAMEEVYAAGKKDKSGSSKKVKSIKKIKSKSKTKK